KHFSLLPNRTFNRTLFVYQICRRLNENRKQTREVIRFSMQEEETRRRRDHHLKFVVKLKPGTTLETLFSQKRLAVIEKFGLVRSREPDKKRNSAFNHLEPLVRKRPRFKPLSLSFFQEREH